VLSDAVPDRVTDDCVVAYVVFVVGDVICIVGAVVSVGAVYIHDCVRVGVPPVHPDGVCVVMVLDCVESGWHVPHVEYVKDVQVGVSVSSSSVADVQPGSAG